MSQEWIDRIIESIRRSELNKIVDKIEPNISDYDNGKFSDHNYPEIRIYLDDDHYSWHGRGWYNNEILLIPDKDGSDGAGSPCYELTINPNAKENRIQTVIAKILDRVSKVTNKYNNEMGYEQEYQDAYDQNIENEYENFFSQLSQTMYDIYDGIDGRPDKEDIADSMIQHVKWIIEDDTDFVYPNNWESIIRKWTNEHFEDPDIVGYLD